MLHTVCIVLRTQHKQFLNNLVDVPYIHLDTDECQQHFRQPENLNYFDIHL